LATTPSIGEGDVARVRDELQTWMQSGYQALEGLASLDQRTVAQVGARQREHVEDEQHSRMRNCCRRGSAPGNDQALLQRGEVGSPLLIGDDDLSVDQRVDWKRLAGADELGEPRGHIACVAAE
jgi:hypothetical protein